MSYMRLSLDTEVRAARMLAAGRVTVTFKSPSGQYITVKAVCKAPEQDGSWRHSSLEDAKIIWFEVPSAGGGYNDRIGKYTQARGFVPSRNSDPARVYCALALLRLVQGQSINPNLEVSVSDHCGRCGRELTKPSSIKLGIGPECAELLGYALDDEGEYHEVKQTPETPERTYQQAFDAVLNRRFDNVTDEELEMLIRSTETARGKFAGNKLYVNKAAKSERDRRRTASDPIDQVLNVVLADTGGVPPSHYSHAPADAPVTDKKGRDLPKTFDELVARVKA